MIHKAIFLLSLYICYLVNGEVTDLIISSPKEGHTYRIGEKVTLICNVQKHSDLSVLFRHKESVAENGVSHSPKKYIANKFSEMGIVKFTLSIVELEWMDHGLWECIHGDSAKTQNISITVPGTVMPIKSQLDLSMITENIVSKENMPNQMLYGRGVRTNPYDLTGRNTRVKLQCVTGCSWPKSKHEWSFQNRNIANSKRSLASSKSEFSTCSFSVTGTGYNTESTVTISCHDLRMVGSNEVTCRMQDFNESQSIFILCPGGHRPWTLTNGEIIGLSIAMGLAALMLVLFFMSAKKIVNSYRYGSMVGGIRV